MEKNYNSFVSNGEKVSHFTTTNTDPKANILEWTPLKVGVYFRSALTIIR